MFFFVIRSVFQWHPELKIGFGYASSRLSSHNQHFYHCIYTSKFILVSKLAIIRYVPTLLTWIDLANNKGRLLQVFPKYIDFRKLIYVLVMLECFQFIDVLQSEYCDWEMYVWSNLQEEVRKCAEALNKAWNWDKILLESCITFCITPVLSQNLYRKYASIL